MSRIEQALAKAAQERRAAQDPSFPKEPFKVLYPNEWGDIDQRIIALFSSNSEAAEQYRRLRTQIMRAKKLYSHNVFMVTSALPGEGKTVTSISLALTIAQGLNCTVLLIDADLRRPTIHRFLNIKAEKGLSDYLSGQRPVEEILVKTKINKLTVIPAGPLPHNPAELVSSDEMETLISEVKNRYQNRIILFDCPPVLSLSDSVILSQKVDGVIMVVHVSKTPREAVIDALSNFTEANVMGIVMNHFNNPSRYYRRYRYNKRYPSYHSYYGSGGYYGYDRNYR